MIAFYVIWPIFVVAVIVLGVRAERPVGIPSRADNFYVVGDKVWVEYACKWRRGRVICPLSSGAFLVKTPRTRRARNIHQIRPRRGWRW